MAALPPTSPLFLWTTEIYDVVQHFSFTLPPHVELPPDMDPSVRTLPIRGSPPSLIQEVYPNYPNTRPPCKIYPFRIHLFPEEANVQIVTGEFGYDNRIYFSTLNIIQHFEIQDIPSFVMEYDSTCAFLSSEGNEPLHGIQPNKLISFLKQLYSVSKKAKVLYQVLKGTRNVHHKSESYGIHNFSVCECGNYFGTSFLDWFNEWKAEK